MFLFFFPFLFVGKWSLQPVPCIKELHNYVQLFDLILHVLHVLRVEINL